MTVLFQLTLITLFIAIGWTIPKLALASLRADILTSAGNGGGPHILRFSSDGKRILSNFFAYNKEYLGWVSIASGDIDGDREPEIVVGSGRDHKGQVKVFELNGTQKFINFFYPFGEHYTQGINVAVGDVDGDFIDEIICGAATDSQAWVKIYKYSSEKTIVAEFMAYHPDFKGGVYLAAGDVDGDGLDEIITGAGYGGGPHVRVFDIKNGKAYPKPMNFWPFHLNYHYGVRVASGDVDGDGKDEIICGQASGQAWIKIYKYDSKRTIVSNFLAYHPSFLGGVSIASGDIDGDGKDEIITGAGKGGGPHIRIFKGDDRAKYTNFFAYDRQFRGGINIAVTNIKKFPTCKNGCRKAKVVDVEDGDTIFLQNGKKVRYIGIDTLELDRKYGKKATEINKKLIKGKEVILEFDTGNLDPYGRVLAYVFVGDLFVNLELVRQGWARVTIYPPDVKYAAILRKAEEIARFKRNGIWQ